MWRWNSGKVLRGNDKVMRSCLSSARITGLKEETLGRDAPSSPQGCTEEDLHHGVARRFQLQSRERAIP